MVKRVSREMKESGVEWIGEIPSTWFSTKLKSVIEKLYSGGTPDSGNEDYYCEFGEEGSIPWVSISDMSTVKEVRSTKKSLTSKGLKSKNLTIIPSETLIYSIYATLGKVTELKTEAVVNQAILGLQINNDKIEKEFLKYWLIFVENYLELFSTSNTQNNLNANKVLNLNLLLPKQSEQVMIVNLLRKKVSSIDSIIEKTKSTIADYKLLKQSIITEAVTKGLNKNVEMKDSGIEWIAEMPKCWDILRGKVVLSKLSRPILESDTVITCFRDGEVTLRSNRREDGFTMADKEIGYQGVEPGDLVVHGMDGFAGAIGISDSRGKSTPVLNVLDSNQNKEYIMFYLRSMAISDVFLALATGIRVRSCDLRWNKIGDLPYPIPPIEEQREIVEHIKNKLQQISVLVEKKQNLLEELESYKKSLIYEYVTGKKEII